MFGFTLAGKIHLAFLLGILLSGVGVVFSSAANEVLRYEYVEGYPRDLQTMGFGSGKLVVEDEQLSLFLLDETAPEGLETYRNIFIAVRDFEQDETIVVEPYQSRLSAQTRQWLERYVVPHLRMTFRPGTNRALAHVHVFYYQRGFRLPRVDLSLPADRQNQLFPSLTRDPLRPGSNVDRPVGKMWLLVTRDDPADALQWQTLSGPSPHNSLSAVLAINDYLNEQDKGRDERIRWANEHARIVEQEKQAALEDARRKEQALTVKVAEAKGILSPHGFYQIDMKKYPTLYRVSVSGGNALAGFNFESIVLESTDPHWGQHSLRHILKRGFWWPDTQQFVQDIGARAQSCTFWEHSGWTGQYKPEVITVAGQNVNVWRDSGQRPAHRRNNEKSKRQCKVMEVDNYCRELLRCLTWFTEDDYVVEAYLVASEAEARVLYEYARKRL